MTLMLKDEDWMRQAFMLPAHAISHQDQIRRVLTDARFKYTDTTLGGSLAINTPPQFTRYADIKAKGKNPKSKGMGRYYSESLDDHGQYVQMRFGVPQYNSLTNFFFNFYNGEAATLARTGRATSLFFDAGKAAAGVVSTLMAPVVWVGQAVRFIINKPASKYYYLKPAMPLYWNAVNTIANAIGVNMGIIPKVFSADQEKIEGEGPGYSKADLMKYHRLLPEIFRPDGGIDIYSVASRGTRLAMAHNDMIQKHLEEATDQGDLRQRLMRYYEDTTGGVETPSDPNFENYLTTYLKLSTSQPPESEEADTESVGTHFEYGAGIAEQTEAEWKDGTGWVTFRVDHTGTASESFSNSVGESELASKINAMSGAARQTRFSMAEGNITGTGFDWIMKKVGEVAGGIAEGFKLNGVAALAGSAFVDIPKVWENSTAELPQITYTMELRSPYGNPLSRYMNLMIPLSMILAAALPLSTGRQSYTSPFLCEAYCKGRAQARLGMITSLSITRGTGNIGWTRNHEPLGIDVSFTVTDMSSVMHMPIKPSIGALEGAATYVAGKMAEVSGAMHEGIGMSKFTGITADSAKDWTEDMIASWSMSTFDDDNAFTDYMAILGSLSLADQVYSGRKHRLAATRRMANFETWKSSGHFINATMNQGITGWGVRTVRSLIHFTSGGPDNVQTM